MRRRLLIAAFVLDGLCALAAPVILPMLGADVARASERYVEVAGVCVEKMDTDGDPATASGRLVDDSFCR